METIRVAMSVEDIEERIRALKRKKAAQSVYWDREIARMQSWLATAKDGEVIGVIRG